MDDNSNISDDAIHRRQTRRDTGGFQHFEEAPTRAIVLVPILSEVHAKQRSASAAGASGQIDGGRDAVIHDPEMRVSEAVGLTEAIGLEVVHAGSVPVPKPRAGELFGPGKVSELAGLMRAEDAEIVVIDHPLTPGQQRNLERAWKRKVVDRTGLILEIFGQRARTKEGKLQVELAHLSWQRTRLVRSWTHLERQRGGVGFMGGPGETQIEADRRQIQERILSIKRELVQVGKTRELHRSGRRRVPYPVVALVGYTNAGKSTLFNRLTGAAVVAKDQLFATLDPTMREIRTEQGRRLILSDTVGFISNLPTSLVAAFRATLEEVIEADVILHVRDMSVADTDAQRDSVLAVLGELGIDVDGPNSPVFEVWNKIDLLDETDQLRLRNRAARYAPENNTSPVMISAVSGQGCERLLTEVDAVLGRSEVDVVAEIAPQDGAALAWLHEHGEIVSRETDDAGVTRVEARLPRPKFGPFSRRLQSCSGPTQLVSPGPVPDDANGVDAG